MHLYAEDTKLIERLQEKESILSEANIKKIKDYMDDLQVEIDEANFNWTKVTKWDRRTLNRTEYVSVLERFYGKLVEVVVAIKVSWKSKNRWQEVIRRVDGYEQILVKNMYYVNMGGYKTVWTLNQNCSYYAWNKEYFNKWYGFHIGNYRLWEHKLYTPADITDPEYKYLKWNGEGFLMDILEHYRENPKSEILNQFGLQDIYSKTVNKLLEEKPFIKWLWKNHEDSNITNLNVMDVRAAYKRDISPTEFFAWNNYRAYEKYGYSYKRFDAYVQSQNELYKKNCLQIYKDYMDACDTLGYNMQDTKTLFPKELQSIHDLRMQEMKSYNAKLDEEKKKELSLKIGEVAKKYSKLEFSNNGLMIILAKCVSDFVYEGEMLHHCVGRMGYDKKMADDQTLILFVRKANDIKNPYVTVEYNPHDKKVLQQYADHDSKPSEEVLAFINTWCNQYAANQIFA